MWTEVLGISELEGYYCSTRRYCKEVTKGLCTVPL